MLSFEQTWGTVFFALTYGDLTGEIDAVKPVTHCICCCFVGGEFVAATDMV
jgi:sugar lactone lactonase YvrE